MAFGFGFGMPRIFSASRAFNPASLFANGEQGWWYDPSNFATLFQDAAGTTPVTAVEQPVGLQLDLSKGLVLGPTLVTNGDFSSATGWTTTNGWSINGGNLNGVAATNSASQNSVTTAGVWYKVSFNYNATLGNVIRICNTSGIALISFTTSSGTSGSLTGYFFATGSTILIEAANAPYTGTIDNFSIKALTGNHRFQSTSANRPVVSARVNLLTKTEQFDDAAWSKSGATVTANVITAPNGALTADKLVETSALAQHATFTSATLAATTYTSIVYAKKDEGPQRWLNLFPQGTGVSASAIFDVTNGIVTATSGAQYIDSDITPVGNDWYLCSITFTGAAVSVTNVVYLSNSGTTSAPGYTGNGTSGIYIWGADLRPTTQGVNLPAYQRVNTSTDYDSTGFPVYIKPNGSNQFMQTNSINFTATDKMTVWQGVRKLSDASTQVFAELSTIVDANNGSWVTFSSPSALAFYNKGTSFSLITTTAGTAAPTTKVLTAIGDISGDITTLRLNGVQVAQSAADLGTGNYGNYPAYFYARAGTSLYFNGNDYGSIARGAASTAAQITAGETYINSKTKAY
jgi:hypothetical protein